MGPELLAVAPYIAMASAAASGAATMYSASAQSSAMEAQAEADQKRAAIDAQWTERRATEERAAAQKQAGNEMRTARLAQSRLGAVAGASGSGASDPTVMNLFEGIEREGQTNASNVTAAGEQKARGMTYQSALDRWTADTNAGIKKSGAKSTLIGGYLSGAGQIGQGFGSAMSMKYGGGKSAAGSTGYGR